MNPAEKSSRSAAIDVDQLGRAIRFALVAIVLGLSYLALRSSLGMASFEQVFLDMLGGKPLPALTAFVLNARPLFLAVALFVPAAAVACLFLRRVALSLYIVGVLALVTLVQSIVLYHALSAPLTQIISMLQEVPADIPPQR